MWHHSWSLAKLSVFFAALSQIVVIDAKTTLLGVLWKAFLCLPSPRKSEFYEKSLKKKVKVNGARSKIEAEIAWRQQKAVWHLLQGLITL